MKHNVFFSLGSNLGEKRTLLKQSIEALQQRVGTLVACSSFIETEPWGFESQHKFLNAAVWFRTDLSPEQVLLTTQQIERELGREKKSTAQGYQDRPIDIDILLYDDIKLDTKVVANGQERRLVIPHPLMLERDFVMVPLREIIDIG